MKKEEQKNVCIIGAGRVATHLATALSARGYAVRAVLSRTLSSAAALAEKVGAEAVTDAAALPDSDTYIYSVSDDAIPALASRISRLRPSALHVHTSGSTPISVFENEHCGVLYPLQTFSWGKEVDFRAVPCFVEGCNESSLAAVTALAGDLSDRVSRLDSRQRLTLHLAAVFASNFTNHCYAIAERLLNEGAGLDFSLLLPLIDETAAKVHALPPCRAQSGPASRGDAAIMQRHLALLEEAPAWREIYKEMSDSIRTLTEKKRERTENRE